MKRLGFILTLALFLAYSLSYSQTTYISVASGAWESQNTWSPTGVPGINDTAIIQTGHEVTINARKILGGKIKIAKLKLQDSAKLSIYNGISFFGNSSITYLYVYDTLENNGLIEGDINSSYYPAEILLYKSLKGTGIIKLIGMYFANSTVTIEKSSDLTFYLSVLVINSNDTVVNYGKVFTDYRIVGADNTSTWINKENSYLAVGDNLLTNGTLICNATGNTVKYAPVHGDIYIKLPKDSTYYNLHIEGSDTSILNNDVIFVKNDFSILASTFDAQSNKIFVGGNWLDNGEFKCSGCSVTFNGTQNQTIQASAYETFNNLSLINSPYNIILKSDIYINDSLNLKTVVQSNGHTVTLGNATNTGTIIYSSGKITGKLSRWIKDTLAGYLYPIGTNDFKTFVNIQFPKIDNPGYVSFEFVDTIPGNSGLPLRDGTGDTAVNAFGDGYWIADTSGGFSLGTHKYNLTLTGEIFKAFTINDSTKIIVRPHQDSAWRFDGHQGTNTPTAYKVARDSLTVFPWQFALADTTHCSPPFLTQIIGPADVCRGDTNVLYTTDTSSKNSFFWNIEGGYIKKNNGDSIWVNWENNGQYATLSVYAENTCSFGNTVRKTIKIHSIPPSVIYGPRAVPVGSDSVLYHIDPLDNYSYQGSVIGNAKIDSISKNQDSAWISFPVAGTDTIQVIASYNAGCPADTAFFSVFVYQTINSVQSGDWYEPSTWDCNCQPQLSDNVRIRDGHTVVVDQYIDRQRGIIYHGFEVNNLIIEKGGILSHTNGNTLEVNGDIINNGIIDYHDQNFILKGTDKIIDGTGVFSVDTVDLQGTRQICTNAIIAVSGNVKINNNFLHNHGKFLVTGDILADNGTLINGYNAQLSIKGRLLPATGELIADSTNNTVAYTGKDQTIKPVSTSSAGYYNLIIAGNGTKTAISDLTVLGDFIIQDTGVFDINYHNLTLLQDWYEVSKAADPFIERTSTVYFNGNGDQYLYAENGETFYNLQIGLNSILNILPKQHFTVTNDLYIDGTLKILMNQASDTLGSIIYNNDIIYGTNGNVQASLFIDSKHWHEVSPVVNNLTSDLFTRAITNLFNPNFYWYDESVDLDGDSTTAPGGAFDNTLLTAGWKYAHNGANGTPVPLSINRGYLFYADRNLTITMSGHAAKVSVTYDTVLSFHNNDPFSDTLPNLYDGWNLVGNPYTAYLNIDSVLKNSVNVDNGVYIWDDYNGQYAGYQNGYSVQSGRLDGYIAPLQGFFVRANSSAATLKLRPQYRTQANQMFLKKDDKDNYDFKRNSIKLCFNANDKAEYFALYFYGKASTSYDPEYDLLHLFTNDPSVPQLFSRKNNISLALMSLPDTLSNFSIVPLFLKNGSATNNMLVVNYIRGLTDKFVILKDLKTQKQYDLRIYDTIRFDYDPEFIHRFDLIIAKDNPPYANDSILSASAYEDSVFKLDLSSIFTDPDRGDSLHFYSPALPDWLAIKGNLLTGIPTQQDTGIYYLDVFAYDILNKSAKIKLILTVYNTNDPPVLNYEIPVLTGLVNKYFEYTIPPGLFTDPDPGDRITLHLDSIPQWLEYDSIQQILYGTPKTTDAGNYRVLIYAKDSHKATSQTFLRINIIYTDKEILVYPNPSQSLVNIISDIDNLGAKIYLFTIDKRLIQTLNINSCKTTIDISTLPPGQYIIEIIKDGKLIRSLKLIKN